MGPALSSGNGISPGALIPPVFGLIDQAGAIENLNGNNLLTGIIQLDGNAGIGVEQLYAERQMAAMNEQIGIADAAYYPSVTLSAGAGLASWPVIRPLATVRARVRESS